MEFKNAEQIEISIRFLSFLRDVFSTELRRLEDHYITLVKDEQLTTEKRIKIVFKLVAELLQIELEDLLSDSRRAKLVDARHIACYLCVEYAGFSKSEVSFFLKQDHTSVVHAIKKVQNLIDVKYYSFFADF